MVGSSPQLNTAGTPIPDENGMLGDLRKYNSEDVLVELPDNMMVGNVTWFAVIKNNTVLSSVMAPKGIKDLAQEEYGQKSSGT